MTHYLKILPIYFDPVCKGIKTFEIRVNDRDFKVGDEVVLCEWDGLCFTGRRCSVVISYIFFGGFGILPGFIVFGFSGVNLLEE